jgi:tetratricopeptide (TPR) repeat protein
MRAFALLSLVAVIITACNNNLSSIETANDLKLGDTIQTASGLKYLYLKKGDGPEIKEGSKVAVYNRLYLNDSKEVFWSTDQSSDSVFTFILGKTSLIKGANELYPKLRQGDEVIAIMPDSIAYGRAGGSGVPPMTTLVFNPIRIKTVSPPKFNLSDTLYEIGRRQDARAVIDKYLALKENGGELYHMDLELLYDLFDRLAVDGEFETFKALAIYFENQAQSRENRLMFAYFKVVAADQLDELKLALEYLDDYIEIYPEEALFANYRARIVQRLNDN